MRYRIVSGLALLFTVACTDSAANNGSENGAGILADATTQGSATGPRSAGETSTLNGTLREQLPVAPYVYVRLETADGEIWAAVNEAPLTLGQPVTVYNAFAMDQFESQTLGRTFDRIYFGSLVPVSAPATETDLAHGSGAVPATPQEAYVNVGSIKRATGDNARAINELWSEKAQLDGATVTVRGVVVKYNAAVMGKNWIHLQDGSGDATLGTHDLAVTSSAETAVGDTVTITGVVRTNQDLGAGYVYTLLVEQATLTKR